MQKSLEILQKYWGYEQFREPQYDIIRSVMNEQDTLAILPTGGGKSVCFQVPALLKEGVCLVISPLVALIQDQVNTLTSKGIKAVALTGSIAFHDLERILNNGIYNAYKFLYLPPERLQNPFVQQKIQQMNICLIAIDEAHCISHWGRDFRPAYLDCKYLKQWFSKVPMIALTASATSEIQKDIISQLQMKNTNIIKKKLNRSNLAYTVYEVDDKFSRLERILTKNKENSIVYVRSRKRTIELSKYLQNQGFSTTFYHGGLSNEEKKTNMTLWMNDKVQTIVATNAFGMGVDKQNVRSVIHWDLPSSIEDYFQEAGRAGRDGKKAFAIILYNQNDVNNLNNNAQMSQISIDYLKILYKKLCSYFYIAYGEGEGFSCSFNFSEFTSRFGLNPFEVYQGLDFLERNGVISFNPSFHRKASVRITATSEQIQKYLKTNPQEKNLLYYLMRTYTGIYNQEIEFKPEKVAHIIEQSPKQISEQLDHLQKNGIIYHKAENTDAEITFLVPREDDKTIYYIAPEIKWFNQHKKEQYLAVLDYIKNKKQCKEQYLISYFGEKSKTPCGICSFCIEQKKKTNNTDYQKDIIDFLKNSPATSQQICQNFSLYESEILFLLQKLVNERKIYKNSTNQYVVL